MRYVIGNVYEVKWEYGKENGQRIKQYKNDKIKKEKRRRECSLARIEHFTAVYFNIQEIVYFYFYVIP